LDADVQHQYQEQDQQAGRQGMDHEDAVIPAPNLDQTAGHANMPSRVITGLMSCLYFQKRGI
jgi:hypothetical protein